MRTQVDINCDMSEGFGAWMFGDDIDAAMMRFVSSINVAAGFHAGDPSTIARTVRLAKEHGVGIGVHPGFRDLVGFGRRHIKATAAELVNDSIYQLGAVREFVRLNGVPLQHFKLHGALYMHAARDEEFAAALVDGLQAVDPELPVLVMGGTAIHQAALDRGQPVVREFYADRDYGEDGQIVFTRKVGALDPDQVAAKVLRACQRGAVETVHGTTIDVEFESVCIHSDTPGAFELMNRTREVLDEAGVQIVSFAA
ncbi:5-oxoprolinase subunit PxpA [Saccharopolyspora hirsuta]|uniref:5-oxoprolinase subunit PxpA n=1 Tax=Saccharopolyspora hirsuta TaxID=1837 RepID=A0A5M7C450_SACHI|nr:5-oxoprolinase subunit PxpA [Saccharopolyspora hirsuta]KAA5835257.1 5-oxoprolinase subunit PxpA [Saccharopolyspora hirsuta]